MGREYNLTSVRRSDFKDNTVIWRNMGTSYTEAHGEAAVAPDESGGAVVMTMTARGRNGQSWVPYEISPATFRAAENRGGAPFKNHRLVSGMDLTANDIPLMVYFSDIGDPASVTVLNPLRKSSDSSVGFEFISGHVEPVNFPLGRSQVFQSLPWLRAIYDSNSTLGGQSNFGPQTIASTFTGRDFVL